MRAVPPTKVVVFGATGNVGRRLVKQGLALGHEVTAFVRNAEKLREQWKGTLPPRLRVVEGSVLEADAVGRALEGQSAAVNAAGHAEDGDVSVEICRTIIAAAERHLAGPKRLWVYGGAAALTLPGTGLLGVDCPGVPAMYLTHKRNWEQLERSSLDWSLVCPGPMTPAPAERLRGDLRVSTDMVAWAFPNWARHLPRIGLSLVMKAHLAETIVTYEDVANLVMSNLAGGGPFSRHRVGIALPRGEKGVKEDWTLGHRGPSQ